MNIGLVFPNKDRRYKTIHLGFAYIAAYARQYHYDINFIVLDTRVATKKETKEFFKNRFELVGITVFSPVYFEVKDIFQKLKQNNVPICLGGPYVTTIMQDIFTETPAEYAIYGEGEETFNQLIFHLKGKDQLENIDGLMYRNEQNNVITNPRRKRIKNLDLLPTPAYDIFPMNRYPLHRIVSSRGCPYACAWCNSSSLWEDGLYWMSPDKIVNEIESLILHYGIKTFVFGDNTFNFDLKRVEEFCDLLLERKIKILWSVSFRPDKVTKELAHKMRKSGCYNVSTGIESANNNILEKLGKKTTIEEIKKGIKILKEENIEIMSQYVIGSPYDTLDTVKESIEFAKTSGCDFTNFYTVLPFKGTPQWEYVKNHGTLYSDKIHNYHMVKPRIVFETPEFNYEDRLKAINLVKKEGFYSNKDTKSWGFDLAKDISMRIQNLLPNKTGNKVFMILKSVYRMKIIKKNNI
ncbi:MAG: radical SAM protein [Bacteroidota bacterium]|nr:radical SAM protein [Bacteroidota bacterium]